ncbi:GlsB/YeaQ/YmgE family stress response membrane protein [Ornithinimicrobium pekingense]|uniref:Membrane protein n=1 Tax=Ornithinimicrobium pekingense TaxID=384677 RepID=A0ABQ2F612_9MICO|nr:GlsB/YeaQ/YmgE family stress response membrane protein [Ornithinimicrobium pekingense]GGK65552.1 membrane protein [Ornithinimicrobium pekingense]
MLWTIVVALIVGCIVGPLARLILPGKQNISLPMTILLGAVGSLIGSWVGANFLGTEGDQFSFWGLILGTIFAIVAVLVYGAVTGRDNSARRIS